MDAHISFGRNWKRHLTSRKALSLLDPALAKANAVDLPAKKWTVVKRLLAPFAPASSN
jgi:hypothetical protein